MTDERLRSVASLPTAKLYAETDVLADRLGVACLAAVLPVVLTSALISGYVGVSGPETEVTRAVTDVAYGVAALAVLGGVYAVLDAPARRAMLRFEVPSRAELLWTVLCFPLAVGGFLFGAAFAERLGFEMGGFGYSLADPVTVGAVLFGGVIVAPLVEEILFRGLLFGSLLGRGRSPVAAGLGSLAVFAGIHVISLGVAGVFAIAAWSVFPTALRMKFDNLTGAWLLHTLNNVYSYLIVVALGLV
jgi:membrane protease YdiL (CAAX protease family)